MPLKGSFKKRTVGETVLQPWRRGALLGWIHCHNSCRIRIGLARLVKGKLKVYRRVTLPHTGWSDYGATIRGSAISDLDGDGKKELLVSYSVDTTPERAVGSKSFTYLAVLALPKLKLQGEFNTGRSGASVHTHCEVTLSRVDPTCSGHPRIIRRSKCREGHCWEFPEEASCRGGSFDLSRAVFVWHKASDRYKPLVEKITLVNDARPWAVVHASIDLDRRRGKKIAERARERLVKAGFSAARVVDGRRYASFRCCYHVVLAGRFASRAEALELVRRLKKKKIAAYARRAF